MADPFKLKEFISGLGVGYKTSSQSYIFDCPLCDKKDKVYFRKSDGLFKCFSCAEINNYKGRPEYGLSKIANLTVKSVQDKLYGDDIISNTPHDFIKLDDIIVIEEDETEDFISNYTEKYYPYNYYSIDDSRAKKGLEYLANERGIPLEIAIKYRLGYSPSERRVILPIWFQGRLLGWQKRTIEANTRYWSEKEQKHKDFPKILTETGSPREEVVMFADSLINTDHVIVCEGPIDAIKADLCGGNVATMGKAISNKQISFINKFPNIKRVYLAIDPDASEEIDNLAERFGKDCYTMLPKTGDLGKMTPTEVYDLYLSAPKYTKDVLYFFMR